MLESTFAKVRPKQGIEAKQSPALNERNESVQKSVCKKTARHQTSLLGFSMKQQKSSKKRENNK